MPNRSAVVPPIAEEKIEPAIADKKRIAAPGRGKSNHAQPRLALYKKTTNKKTNNHSNPFKKGGSREDRGTDTLQGPAPRKSGNKTKHLQGSRGSNSIQAREAPLGIRKSFQDFFARANEEEKAANPKVKRGSAKGGVMESWPSQFGRKPNYHWNEEEKKI